MNNDKNFIIYIPGLFSSYLLKGNDVIWPIVNKEIIKLCFTNYIKNPLKKFFLNNQHKIEDQENLNDYILKLSDKNLKPGGLTKNNDNIINLIKKHTDNKNFFIFTYDWRENFDVIIDLLDKSINNLDVSNKNITIISHSAGGIIGYKYINSIEKYSKTKNFKKINKFITIGCPIEGSIKALTVIMGLYHQSILTSENIEKILNEGFFKSIYELIPANIQNLFFYKTTKKLLPGNEIVKLLLNNGFTEETIRKSSEFREEMNNLTHNYNVDFLFIIGIYNKEPMCVGFEVDSETNDINPIYDYSSDGTILFYEAMPMITHRFRTRYVSGKHMYLTEYDETLKIIENEINFAEENKHIIISKSIETNTNNIEFYLYVIINKIKYIIKDINAEKILFSYKTNVQDITKYIKHNKKKNTFFFSSIYKYGTLKFKNLIIHYDVSIKEPPLEIQNCKNNILDDSNKLEELNNINNLENDNKNIIENDNNDNNIKQQNKHKIKEFFKNINVEINKVSLDYLF